MKESTMKKVKLGKRYKDKIQGFEGVCTSIHTYLTGCTRVSLESMVQGDLKEYCFDVTRLVEVDKDEKPIVIDQEKPEKRKGGFKPNETSLNRI